MDLWRISNFATLDGSGGLRASARWHTKGRRIVYLAESPAGALTEVLVHLELDASNLPRHYKLMKAHAPDAISVRQLTKADLSDHWTNDEAETRAIGDVWLASLATVLLRVPSAIVPESFNVLFNPAHPDASRVQVVDCHEYPWDRRLLE